MRGSLLWRTRSQRCMHRCSIESEFIGGGATVASALRADHELETGLISGSTRAGGGSGHQHPACEPGGLACIWRYCAAPWHERRTSNLCRPRKSLRLTRKSGLWKYEKLPVQRPTANAPPDDSAAFCNDMRFTLGHPVTLKAMEQRYTALAEDQGRLAAENKRLTSEHEQLAKVLDIHCCPLSNLSPICRQPDRLCMGRLTLHRLC